MPPLEDRCFAVDAGLMPFDRALALLADKMRPVVGVETVAIKAALGRVLAEDVIAGLDVPLHDNAAVDGYAVFAADLAAGGTTRLPVTGRIAAGHPLDRPARPGEALRVFTGAPLPAGPDTVIMEEDCRVDGDAVVLPAGVAPGAHRRQRAEDIRAGSVILTAGSVLRPQDVGLVASIGLGRLPVRERLRVAVFSTGDEVRDPGPPGAAIPPGAIFDSNRYAIMGLLERLGVAVTDLGILPDSPEAIRDALAGAARRHHVLVTSGGVSRGEEDHVRAAVEALGSLYVWRLAIKPGRPVAFGQIGAAVFIGLPGNPVAAMVTLMRLGRPVLFTLAGARVRPPTFFPVVAGFDYQGKKPGRREWLRARLATDAAGRPMAMRFPSGGSGILTSMVQADGLVELGDDAGPVTEGALVDFLPFSEVGA